MPAWTKFNGFASVESIDVLKRLIMVRIAIFDNSITIFIKSAPPGNSTICILKGPKVHPNFRWHSFKYVSVWFLNLYHQWNSLPNVMIECKRKVKKERNYLNSHSSTVDLIGQRNRLRNSCALIITSKKWMRWWNALLLVLVNVPFVQPNWNQNEFTLNCRYKLWNKYLCEMWLVTVTDRVMKH